MVRVVGEGFPTEALVDFTTTKYVARISGYNLEKWQKEYDIDEVMNVLVPKLRCVNVNAFEEHWCFAVED